MLAAGILVVAGFSGGFALSNGSGQILGMKPVHKAQSKAGNADEVAAAGIYNAAQGDGPGGGEGSHPTLAQSEGGAGGQDAAAGEATVGTGGAMSAAGASVPKADPEAEKNGLALIGADAAAFLSGNTVDADLSKPGRHLVYYAPRGLQAVGDARRYVVKTWNSKTASACVPGSDGALVCRPLQVRKDPGAQKAGRVGTMLVGDDWVPIYKGNLLRVPDHIPLVDSALAEAAPVVTRRPKTPIKGRPAVDLLVGHTASVAEPDASSGVSAVLVSYRPDGTLLTMDRPADDLRQPDGVAVAVGQWTFAKGLLCQGEKAPGAPRTCFKPEAWSRRSVHLVPVGEGPERQLDFLGETPLRPLEAAN